MQLCLLWHGPNGSMVSFMDITVVLTIMDVVLTIIMLPMVILLCHGEVTLGAVMISRQSSSFANLPSTKSPPEPPVTFLSFLSSY
jgi:hypothetical protein